MAEEILTFKVDQSDLLQKAAASKQAIIETREEVKELNKTFKDGSISVEDYAKESVQLEKKLKTEQQTYNNLTKAINTNSNSLDAQRLKLAELTRERNKLDRSTAQGVKEFDRLTKEIKELNTEIGKHEKKAGDFRRDVGKYKDSIKDAANELNIAGVNVGSLTTKITSFANPATAAVAVVTALGAAYARSTIGAKDLEFAQNQLAAATTIVTNRLAESISSAKDGEGIFTRLADAFLAVASFKFSSILTAEDVANARSVAFAIAQLGDLQKEEIEVRERINDRLADNQELQTQIADEQTSLNDKLGLSVQIVDNLRTNESELVTVLESQLRLLEEQLSIDQNNDALQTAVLEKSREISKVKKDIDRQVQAQLRGERDILDSIAKQAEFARALQRAQGRQELGDPSLGVQSEVTAAITAAEQISDVQIDAAAAQINAKERLAKDIKKINKEITDDEKEQARQSAEFAKFKERAELQAASDLSAGLAQIFEEGSELQKTFALFSIATDTAEAIASLTAASEANPLNAITFGGAGIAQFASGLIRIFTNIASAKNLLGFAEGGQTGSGSGLPDSTGFRPAGIVHEHEYVVPKHVNLSSAAQPHISALERMRMGSYADGGQVVASQATSEVNQNLAMMNAIKMLPAPVVGVKQFHDVERKLEIKQNVSSR